MSGSTDAFPVFAGLPGQALRQRFTPDVLARWLGDSRQRSLVLIGDLDDERLTPSLRFHLGRPGWFAEKWVLRRHGEPSLRADADEVYGGGERTPPGRRETLAYLKGVESRLLSRLEEPSLGVEDTYFFLLAIFHEDLRGEEIVALRQALGYPAPALPRPADGGLTSGRGPWTGDVEVAGGKFLLGAMPGEPFVHDNEKWAHPVDVKPFRIARAPVTQGEFAGFAEDGYRRRDLWSEAGWRWRETAGVEGPLYWRREGGWQQRVFDRWVKLEPDLPMTHVNWYEAEAYSRWARRRLPAEIEWEVVAAGEPAAEGLRLSVYKRRFPWGDEAPGEAHANLDGRACACLDVSACAAGDSAFGCRQLIGNVWEWTASDFQPYPGFAPDPDRDYSMPCFGTHKVLRGGCWLTRGRMLSNTWRLFHRPDRRAPWAGFRTCALS